MTIVLVILAVLILLAVLFLIRRVNKVADSILSAMMDRYSGIYNYLTVLENNVTTQVNTVTTAVNDARTDVVRLANKVDEGLTHCGNQTRDLKEKFGNLETRITAPIDKINDTHNRVKTLGKGCIGSDEVREIVAQVTNAAVTHGVDQVRTMFEEQAKIKTASKTKKAVKAPITKVKD